MMLHKTETEDTPGKAPVDVGCESTSSKVGVRNNLQCSAVARSNESNATYGHVEGGTMHTHANTLKYNVGAWPCNLLQPLAAGESTLQLVALFSAGSQRCCDLIS